MNKDRNIKKIKTANIVAVSCFIIIMIGCTKTEYIDVDVDPQLEITVVDISDNSVQGASINLYRSETDWESKTNLVMQKSTGSDGKALFEDLEATTYYFYVQKNDLSNLYEVATFQNPLKKNEIRTITCTIR